MRDGEPPGEEAAEQQDEEREVAVQLGEVQEAAAQKGQEAAVQLGVDQEVAGQLDEP